MAPLVPVAIIALSDALDDSRQLRDGFLGQLGFRDVAQQADTLGRLAGNRVGFR